MTCDGGDSRFSLQRRVHPSPGTGGTLLRRKALSQLTGPGSPVSGPVLAQRILVNSHFTSRLPGTQTLYICFPTDKTPSYTFLIRRGFLVGAEHTQHPAGTRTRRTYVSCKSMRVAVLLTLA